MKCKTVFQMVTALVIVFVTAFSGKKPEEKAGWKALFNGKNLDR